MSKHKIIPMDNVPERTYTKPSIYDDVIDDFVKRNISLAKIEMSKKDGTPLEGTYLSGRLAKRLKERKITTVKARTINKESYLQQVEGE